MIFNKKLDRFVWQLEAARTVEAAVFYFAGHGYQEGNKNYLLPLPEPDGHIQGISLARVLSSIEKKAACRIVFLDACRKYFNKIGVREALEKTRAPAVGALTITPGLGEYGYGPGTFIAFSAAPGQPAYDGDSASGLSPFAAALLDCIDRVERPINNVMQEVREKVFETTGNKQETWDSNNLSRPFFFKPFPYLFLVVNALPIMAVLISIALFALAFSADMFALASNGAETRFGLTFTTFLILILSLVLLFHGVRRISTWQRGDLIYIDSYRGLWPTGIQCALGGMVSGLASMPIIALPYWWSWRQDSANQGCKDYFLLSADAPEHCPPFVLIMVESALASVYIQAFLAYLSVHYAIRFLNSKWSGLRGLTPTHRFIVGASFGGMIAGFGLGASVTAYFGSQPRPFFELSLSMAFAAVCIIFLAFSVVNYSLLQFSLERIWRSLVASTISAFTVLLLSGVTIFALYQIGLVDQFFAWAFDGFWNLEKPIFERFGYLSVAGAGYGGVVGIFLGLLIGLAFVLTRIDLRTEASHDPPKVPPDTPIPENN